MKALRETYPRRRNLKRLYTQDVEALTNIVGVENAVYHSDENMGRLNAHNKDWLGQIQGASKMVLFPRTTAHVSEVLKYCHSDRIAVVPQGGNTGLVYGSVPLFDEVIISMTKHRLTLPEGVSVGGTEADQQLAGSMQFNSQTNSCLCSASVILEDFQKFAASKDRIAPLDMGSRGSCTIGGNLATNAGGIHYARYGSLRSNTCGIEVVGADGTIVSSLRNTTNTTPILHRRDNSIGVDMAHLFIGSEGTLGIITAAEINLHTKPTNHQLLMYHVSTIEDVLSLFQIAKGSLHNSLSAFEVMDVQGLSAAFGAEDLKAQLPSIAKALDGGESSAAPTFCVMIEVQSTDAEVDLLRIERIVNKIETGKSVNVVDQVAADSIAAVKSLWSVREDLPVKLAQRGRIFKYDLCFPFDKFYSSVEFARAKFVKDIFGEDYLSKDYKGVVPEEVLATLQEDVCFSGYGHFGDGNVHLNIIDRTPESYYSEYIKDDLSPAIYEFCVKTGGSVSAEHGIGLQKKPYLYASRDRASIEAMKTVKRVMDPKAILNPYKLL